MKTTTFLKQALAALVLLLASVPVFAQFRVIGYVPSWAGDVSSVQYGKLTHINYAFLLPTATGGLQPIENPAKLQNLVATAHANGVKVLISVGGWNNGDDSAFETIGANASYRNAFVTNLVNFANQYNLDGVDIDWEYPDAGALANNYAVLMQQLATEMHNRGKLLTAAVVATGGAGVLNSVFGYVDFLNLMAYDANNFDHSTYDYAVQSINYWKGRGLATSKTVLGVPFYGRPSWESYAQLLTRGASPNADVFNGVGYNGIPTIKSKTNLAFDQASGIMIWELSQDAIGANSLLTAINQVVVQRGGNTAPAQAIPGKLEAEGFTAQQGTDKEPTTDTGGGQNVDYFETGDWLDYTVNVASAGTYAVGFRVASANGGATLQLRNGNGAVLGSINVGNTGGWQSWQTISTTVTLPVGRQVLRLYASASTGCNVNWLNFTGATSSFSTTFQAESYSSMNGVQVESCSDAGGGQNVGYIDAGDWLAYSNLTIPTTGSYLIEYRVASLGGGTVSSDLNAGSVQLGSTVIPATGGWQSWTTVSRTVTLNAGTYSFGVYAQTGGWNLNWVRISKAGVARVSSAAEPTPTALNTTPISLFPNPATDRITVQGTELLGSSYQVLDAYGKVKSSGIVSSKQVDLSGLPSGVYTLRIVTPQHQKITRQLIKQ
ncbi:carbohydrate-binding protein [Hymenobacter swuensis]|uniref:chitinase n=1 Tax=Hymenobacter swuensis DY53 TaxID=1227739 RepID=W8F300_9BACT|nr:carbohydrate-binding protein [Hymenobacter swuensis]AHJ96926.1 glycoside hydrolase family protein [Hymenobacter swuensis DY53]